MLSSYSAALKAAIVLLLFFGSEITSSVVGYPAHPRRSTCSNEIEGANRTISNWSVTMRRMMEESILSNSTLDEAVKEESKIRDLIESFGANINKKPIESLVKDLVSIRRRSNKMALEIYLKTFDMRWPQTSVQLGVAVERVQQACLSSLDRAATLVLNSPFKVSSRVKSLWP